MALAAALLTRQRVAAMKLESVPGTAEVLAAADAVANVFDMKLEPMITTVEREGQYSLSPLAPVPGATAGKATFKTELTTATTFMTSLLNSCGLATSTPFIPVSADFTPATVGSFIAGRYFQIHSAMGKFTMTAEAGKPALLDVEYNGIWDAPTAVALLGSVAYPLTIPPRVASCTFTLGGTTFLVPKIELVVDNTLTMREDVTNASGYAGCCISARKISVKVSPEAMALGTKDWFAAHMASTQVAMNLIIGTCTIACPKLALLNPPGYEDSNGIYRDALEFVSVRSAAAGDDELSITWSA